MWKRTVVIFILLVAVVKLSNAIDHNVTSSKEIKSFLRNLFKNKHLLDELAAIDQSNVIKDCLLPIVDLENADRISLLDSTFKPPAGLLTGNIQWLGNYRECMKQEDLHFCTMSDVLAFQKLPLTLGVCVPKKCKSNDVREIFKKIAQYRNVSTFFTVYDNVNNINNFGTDHVCYDKEKLYTSGAKVMIIVCIAILLLCLIGTVVDVVSKEMRESNKNVYKIINESNEKDYEGLSKTKDNEELVLKTENKISMHQVDISNTDPLVVRFFVCFSVLKNARSILNTNMPKGSITSLNGMRTISITWVILGHCLVFALQYLDDVQDVFSWVNGFAMQAIINASPSVDSFFFLSGLLVGYLCMKQYNNKGKLPLLRYYLHRYIRLTPSYAFVILFWMYVYPILGNGPNWYTQGPHSAQVENCEKYWWTNLLYISNFYPELQNMCMNWSWYLSNDMQFYVISPIILYAMYRFKWIGLLLSNGIFLLACFIVNGVLIYHYKLSPLFIDLTTAFTDPKGRNPTLLYMKYVYMKPYTRIAPYLVGLVFGYLLINKCEVPQRFKKVFYSIGWMVAIATGLAVIYGPYSQTSSPWGMTERLTYGLFFRFVWAIAIGWVIYASHNGRGGLVHSFLSWKAFVPLSRLSYGVYLIHPLVIFLFFASTMSTTDMTKTFYVYFFVASTTLSFMGAFLLAVCVEYPIFNLEKLIFNF